MNGIDPQGMVSCYHAGRHVQIPNWLADRAEDGLTAMQRGGRLFDEFDFTWLRGQLDRYAVDVVETPRLSSRRNA